MFAASRDRQGQLMALTTVGVALIVVLSVLRVRRRAQ